MNDNERMTIVEDRLGRVELSLLALEARMRRLEPATVGMPTPPPRQAQVWTPQYEALTAPAPPPPLAKAPVAAGAAGPDLEYRLGSTGLLWAGALVTVLGLLYLVALAIARGMISPAVQFAGELLLCAGFMGFGFWKRDLRQDFGGMLVGIGSGGVFASLAGAHVYKGLFGSELLVGLFFAWGLVNLGMGWLRSSKSLWTIGILGGLAASVMPARDHLLWPMALLNIAIILPAAQIAGRQRWSDHLICGWLLSGLALAPLCFEAGDWKVRVAAVYVSTLVWVVTYALRTERSKFDPQLWFAPIALFVAGWVGFGLHGGVWGAAHIGIFASVSVLVGLLARQDRLVVGGVLVAMVFAPFYGPASSAAAIEAGLAVGFALLTLRWSLPALSKFSLVAFGLAVGAYLAATQESPAMTWQHESLLLVGMLVGAAGAAFSLKALRDKASEGALLLSILAIPLIGRLTWVSLGTTQLPLPGAIVIALLVCAGAAMAFGSRRNWIPVLVTGWLSLSVATLLYIGVLLKQGPMPAGFDLVVILTGMAAIAAGWTWTEGRTPESDRAILGSLLSFAGLLVLSRLGHVLLTLPAVGWSAPVASTVALLGSGLVATSAGVLRRSGPALVLGALMVGLGALSYGRIYGPEQPNLQILCVSLGIVACLGTAWGGMRIGKNLDLILAGCAFAGWLMVTRLGVLTLDATSLGFGATTAVWTAYGILLIGLGFWLSQRTLRYAGLLGFGAAAAKLLLVDLAGADQAVRVILSMGLGVAMIGGAFWYIRSAQNSGNSRNIP